MYILNTYIYKIKPIFVLATSGGKTGNMKRM